MERTSVWLFKEGATPRLIMLDGEQFFDTAATSETFTFSFSSSYLNGSFSRLDILPDGSASYVKGSTASNGDGVSWLIAGKSHTGQPHASLEAPGASALAPILITGASAPDEFPSSTYWSSIRKAQLLPGGGNFWRHNCGYSNIFSDTTSSSNDRIIYLPIEIGSLSQCVL